MAVALVLAVLIAIIAFAFFLMWGMPRIFRGHHDDSGMALGGTSHHSGSDSGSSHSDGGGHGGDSSP
ncbi:MAG TPA: hypothetical protein VGJ56_23435 [Reyranella sp.]|jgi:uncharacterized membrane protein